MKRVFRGPWLWIVVAVVIVVATGYALVHQHDLLRNAPGFQTAGAVLPDATGQARR